MVYCSFLKEQLQLISIKLIVSFCWKKPQSAQFQYYSVNSMLIDFLAVKCSVPSYTHLNSLQLKVIWVKHLFPNNDIIVYQTHPAPLRLTPTRQVAWKLIM